MRVLLLILGFGLAIISCDRQENTEHRIKSFDFSYDNVFSSCFSIKFTEGDTVFARQHFTTSDIPRINTNYYAVLSKRDRNALDSIISRINHLQLDSLYYQSYEDGIHYQFCFETDKARKCVRVHSDSVPIPLQNLELWVLKIKERLSLNGIDKSIDFPSAKVVVLPPPKEVKFQLPDVE